MGRDGGQVQVVAVLRQDPATGVADGDHMGALFLQETRRHPADLPETLDRHPRPDELRAARQPTLGQETFDAVDAATSGGLAAPLRAPELQGLAGDHRQVVLTRVQSVISVVDPGHGLGVGIHVRRRHIREGSDVVSQLGDIAPGDAPLLPLAQPLGVAGHAALGPAEGQAEQGALPAHEGGECRDLRQVHPWVVADAPLPWTQDPAVQDPITGEALDAAVVHLDRQVHADGLARQAQEVHQSGGDMSQMGAGPPELLGDDPLGGELRGGRRLIRACWFAHGLGASSMPGPTWKRLRGLQDQRPQGRGETAAVRDLGMQLP